MQREATHIWFMNALRTQLLETAAAYCAVKSISMSTLSHKIVNDGKVLDRIAAGRDIQTATFERFMAWFAQNWPGVTVRGRPFLPSGAFDPFYP